MLVYLTLSLLVTCVVNLSGCFASDLEDSRFKLVCYYTNWGIYRPSLAKFTPENINPYMCTHLIYAFGGLSPRFEIKPFDSYNDIQQGNYKKFTGLKRYNDKLKTMIAVGGWNEGSKKFSAMVASKENRQTFIRSVMKFLRQHDFDGLDLDWEYPTFRDGSHPEDKEGYLELVKELREAFDNEKLGRSKSKLLLTMAMPAGRQYIEQGYDVPALSKELDFFNLLTYDYYTSQDGTVNHHSALYGEDNLEEWDPEKLLNVDWTVNFYMELGAPAEMLVVGIPAYGRSFTLDEHEDPVLGAVAKGPGEAGTTTREEGYLAYHEICQKVLHDGWEVEKPFPDAVGPFAHKGDQWVGYDDEEMVTRKAKYAVEHHLGGVMFWALDTDDFRGKCGGENSPLISAARKALLSLDGSSSSDDIKPVKSFVFTTPEEELVDSTTEEEEPVESTTEEEEPETTTTTTTTTTPATTEAAEEEEEDLTEVAGTTVVEQDSSENEYPVVKVKERSDDEDDDCETAGSSRKRNCRGRGGSRDRLATPEPPTTPDPGPQFECTDEGFFPNPKDCRKYFWCLDSGPADLGIVPHHFTCPSGLHFNTFTDSCDYADNVKCKSAPSAASADSRKKTPSTTTRRPSTSARTTTKTTTTTEDSSPSTTEGSSNIAQLLKLIEKLGGVEEVQKHLGINDGTSAASETAVPVTTTTSKTTTTSPRRRGHRRTTTRRPSSTTSAASRRRHRPTTTTTTTERSTTTTSQRPVSRRGPSASRRKTSTTTTTTEATSTARQMFRQRSSLLPTTTSDELEVRMDAQGSSTSPTVIHEELVLETFGSTRIPGLFKYVPLRRGDARTNASTVVTDEQKLEIPTTAAVDDDDDLDIAIKESSNNVHVTSFQLADAPTTEDVEVTSTTTSELPPFENIGVHLEEDEDEENEDQNLEKKGSLDVTTTVEATTTEELLVADEGRTEDSVVEATTTSVVPKQKVVLRKRQRSRKPISTTTTTTTTTAAPTTTRTTTKVPSTTVSVTTVLLPHRRAIARPSKDNEDSKPDSKVRLVVRNNKQQQSSSDFNNTFQGLAVNDHGHLECIEQGVYPHPLDCRKFVSCISEHGSIRLWTYACPEPQLYDDFTGRCLDKTLVSCQS